MTASLFLPLSSSTSPSGSSSSPITSHPLTEENQFYLALDVTPMLGKITANCRHDLTKNTGRERPASMPYFFLLTHLAKAPAVDLLKLNTLTDTKTLFFVLIPQR